MGPDFKYRMKNGYASFWDVYRRRIRTEVRKRVSDLLMVVVPCFFVYLGSNESWFTLFCLGDVNRGIDL